MSRASAKARQLVTELIVAAIDVQGGYEPLANRERCEAALLGYIRRLEEDRRDAETENLNLLSDRRKLMRELETKS